MLLTGLAATTATASASGMWGGYPPPPAGYTLAPDGVYVKNVNGDYHTYKPWLGTGGHGRETARQRELNELRATRDLQWMKQRNPAMSPARVGKTVAPYISQPFLAPLTNAAKDKILGPMRNLLPKVPRIFGPLAGATTAYALCDLFLKAGCWLFDKSPEASGGTYTVLSDCTWNSSNYRITCASGGYAGDCTQTNCSQLMGITFKLLIPPGAASSGSRGRWGQPSCKGVGQDTIDGDGWNFVGEITVNAGCDNLWEYGTPNRVYTYAWQPSEPTVNVTPPTLNDGTGSAPGTPSGTTVWPGDGDPVIDESKYGDLGDAFLGDPAPAGNIAQQQAGAIISAEEAANEDAGLVRVPPIPAGMRGPQYAELVAAAGLAPRTKLLTQEEVPLDAEPDSVQGVYPAPGSYVEPGTTVVIDQAPASGGSEYGGGVVGGCDDTTTIAPLEFPTINVSERFPFGVIAWVGNWVGQFADASAPEFTLVTPVGDMHVSMGWTQPAVDVGRVVIPICAAVLMLVSLANLLGRFSVDRSLSKV